MRTLSARLAACSLLGMLGACEAPAPPATITTTPVVVFTCHRILIGLSTVSCTEDIQGPGVLSLAFRPDPPQTSWELRVRGLAALAETCEFHGSFDQTRLSALQGRGATEIVCPLAPSVDRAYHQLSFENLTDAPNTSIGITATLTR